MKKSDLKSGMIVEFRNGIQDIVMLNPECEGRELISLEGGSLRLDDYNEDLTYRIASNANWDIVKIYSLGSSISHILLNKEKTLSNKKLIWERTEPIEMTIAEIEAKLGIKNLKIIKE